ncbi:hypothetical protein ACFVGM_25190 [Kitasatospora purpeofusca]|uniref:hypothetical protein n=1 Tax=Kitasatospora purpeofusca TaxID=67352 RepID=UPI0036A4CB62
MWRGWAWGGPGARHGRIDVLVDNAGRGLVGAVEEYTDRDLRDLMDLHFLAAERTPLRLPLGSDAVDAVLGSLEASVEELRTWESVGRSTDFDA